MELNFEGTCSASYLIEKYSHVARKSLGQNFLVDDFALADIAASALSDEKNKFVLEIGPGLGFLTQYLVANAENVVAIELDSHLVKILEDSFKGKANFNIEHADFLDEKINDAFLCDKFCALCSKTPSEGEKIKVVANLPYYITSPIITKLLCEMDTVGDIFVLVQREVADRMAAGEGHSAFGVFSILCQFYSNVQILFDVAPDCFEPAPKVYSSFVELRKNNEYKNLLCNTFNVTDGDKKNKLVKKFFDFVKFSFMHKRKTLINNLCDKYDKEHLHKILDNLGLDQRVRPEEISIKNFIKLFKEVNNPDI
jgi:16S rRNA (adenine1518-N6/adenine1519-N6)-dimethyltransferase